MTDLALIWNPALFSADLALSAPDLATDAGLDTAVIISLFTDRRAREDDELPTGSNDPRGWWGDSFAEVTGDQIGSRLWLFERAKQTQATLNGYREALEEAVAWMVEDGIAESVKASTWIINPGQMGWSLEIKRPNDPRPRRYDHLWSNT